MDKREMRAFVKAHKVAEDVTSLWAAVESCEAFESARCVLLYHSLPDEVPTADFIRKWHGAKRIALPLVVGDSLILKEYDPALMCEGYRGIMEPCSDARDILPSEIDFALIPGMAFDSAGHRLGRGKGFYDRLLPQLSCTTAGVAFNCQMFDSVPCESHDAAVDLVFHPISAS